MKIYFAGSIRGGRQDAERYERVIHLLKQYGRVLTEHVGNTGLDEDSRSDAAIYRRDMGWLREADVLIAEVTIPSHGVGYEVARAETWGKPILCLHRLESAGSLSALLGGNRGIDCRSYEEPEQLTEILHEFFRKHERRLEHPS